MRNQIKIYHIRGQNAIPLRQFFVKATCKIMYIMKLFAAAVKKMSIDSKPVIKFYDFGEFILDFGVKSGKMVMTKT